MESNINISTINRYFCGKKTSKNEDNCNKSYRMKILKYSFFSVNEANICDKVFKIPYYTNYFSPLEEFDYLSISQLNEEIIEKLTNLDINKYLLFKYNDKNSIDFTEYLYNFTTVKSLVFNIIDICRHLLNSLDILNDNDICFFHLTPKNIIFLENYRKKPVLSDFMFSLNLNRLNYKYISNFLSKITDLTYQSFEINILYYFVNSNIKTISYSFIEEFSENYIKNLSFLTLFSENYKKMYKEQCIEILKVYVNKPQEYIIDDILERNDKWDVYSISLIFFQIFGCISRIFSLKGTFFSKITLQMARNLHPDSNKRMTLKETFEVFNLLLEEQDNWNFIDNLDNNKLQQLYDDFSK